MKKYQKMFDKGKKEDQSIIMDEVNPVEEVTTKPDSLLNKSDKQIETVILAGMRFRGDITGTHNLFLNGEFDGTVDLSALLFVGQSGKLVGEVKAERIIIEGEIEGTMTAREKIELREGGKCKGDILAPSVMISDKAFFQGQVTMTGDDEKFDEKMTDEKSEAKSKDESMKITVVNDIQNEKAGEQSKERRRKLVAN